ncbi:MAG: riboflavin synthase [Chitinophagaceae bacterium]|nr:MAG: riboflavin synthase [Chitinophagaceae bacterium]
MFTGIIESLGLIEDIASHGSNKTFWISSPISSSFKIDQSVSHNGVCLTVEEISGDRHRVTAIDETLSVTDLANWETGSLINLEQCLRFNGRIDGHIVQGHVDATGTCFSKTAKDGSWEITINYPEHFAPLIIEKGSICLNGISLTIFNITKSSFTVAIIPYTMEHTNMGRLDAGQTVNLEFDVVGKYIQRRADLGIL